MSKFKPCQGKTACRDDGQQCLTCGRSFEEISQLRNLLDQLTNLAIDYKYENSGEYLRYVTRKVAKNIEYRKQQVS